MNFEDDFLKRSIKVIRGKSESNNLKLDDVSGSDFLKLRNEIIFNDSRVEILNKKVELLDMSYVSMEVDVLQKKYLVEDEYVEKINSYINGIDIELRRKNVRMVLVNYIGNTNKINILVPVSDDDIIAGKGYQYYLTKDIELDSNSVVIISYDDFLKLDDVELEILKNSYVILSEDYQQISNINFWLESNNFIKNRAFNNIIVKINHLVYLVDNSNLNNDRKRYYSYWFKEYYFKVTEGNSLVKAFEIKDMAFNFSLEVGSVFVEEFTAKFSMMSFDEQTKEVKKETFSSELFLNNIGNMSELSSIGLLKIINGLDEKDRKKILSTDSVKNKLRYDILVDASFEPWNYFRDSYDNLFKFLTVKEVLELYDGKFLEKWFKDKKDKVEYVFYAILCIRDVNFTIKYVLNDDKFFDKFFSRYNEFYSCLGNLDYELFLEVIDKMEERGFSYKNYFIFTKERQYKLLKESFSDEALIWLLKGFSNEVLSFFFQNEEAGKRIWPFFNVVFLADCGVKFSDSIVESLEFFERLKNESLVSFRSNINIVQRKNASVLLLKRVFKYYDELLNSYNRASGMFYEYEEILEGKVVDMWNFILSSDVVDAIRNKCDNIYYDDNKVSRERTFFLKKRTNEKISEIVVDGLFQDNIYNVWINIKEMLRYNEILSDKILDEEKVKFYEMILRIDKVSCEDKIEIYHKLKNSKINYIFYNDLRKIKDLSYSKIKDNLIKLGDHPDYVDKELSDKCGVLVYDLRERQYTMLVRAMNKFSFETMNGRGCYTLLSDKNTDMFSGRFVYGYDDFDVDCVLHIFEGDSYSSDEVDDDLSSGSNYVNRVATSRQIVESSGMYSEIQIKNKRLDNKIFQALKPSFLVVIDRVSEMDLKESKRLNIPIVIIKVKYLDKELGELKFNERFDKYISRHNSYGNELERRNQR